MNPLRKLSWTVLLAATGLLGMGSAPVEAQRGAVSPLPGWPWPLVDEEEEFLLELEDEFEGDGWSFWGL
jgi:hypothetical protein